MCRNDLSYEPLYHFDPLLITPLDHPLAGKTEIVARGSFAVRPDPAAEAPDHLSPGRPGLPASARCRTTSPSRSAAGRSSSNTWRWDSASRSSPASASARPIASAWPCATCAHTFRNAATAWSCARARYLSAEARAFIDLIQPGLFVAPGLVRIGSLGALSRWPACVAAGLPWIFIALPAGFRRSAAFRVSGAIW